MPSTTCPAAADLAAFLRGDLPEADGDQVAAHLEICASCERAAQTQDEAADPVVAVLRQFSGGPLRAGDSGGSLTTFVLPPGAVPDWAGPGRLAPRRMGEYDLLEELGRGGMGVVYKAWHGPLKRFVALKVIRTGEYASASEALRFRREAEALARVRHPNLVQIYEIGQHHGLPFLALEFVAGRSLDKYLAGQPQPAEAAAQLVGQLADAVEAAHRQGVVHRDLKPANILLEDQDAGQSDGSFIVKVTDFGLAKCLDGGAGGSGTGMVAGTPSYMAPEQAAGRSGEVGPAADVYALGAILYEMLVGRPPFQGESATDTLLSVLREEPIPPSRLRPRVPRDLETICLKCLEKDPRNRYASAAALAEDVRRYRAGEPVVARPVGPLGRAIKWARRRPVIAGLLATVFLLTVMGFGLMTKLWERAAALAAEERNGRLQVERLSAGVWLDQGAARCERGDVAEGLLAYTRALTLAERAGDADLEHVARTNLATWPARLVRLHAHFGHNSWAYAIAYSPDGQTILTGGDDRLAKVWDAATGRELSPALEHTLPVWSIAVSPDGRTALTGGGSMDEKTGEARLWDLETRTSRILPQPGGVRAVAFDRDGGRCLTVCGAGALIWDVKTGGLHAELHHGDAQVTTGLFSPDGRWVLTGGSDHAGRLWDADTGRQQGPPLAHDGEGEINVVAFRPDGAVVFTGSQDGSGRLWNPATGRQLGEDLLHRGPIRAAAFSPDSRQLAVACALEEATHKEGPRRQVGGDVQLRDANDGHSILPLPHESSVWSVAFAPDSRLLLTGARDGKARLFDTASGALVGKPLIHEGTVVKVAFGPPGVATALTASAGGDKYAAARLWRLPPVGPSDRPLEIKQVTNAVLFHPTQPALLLAGSRNPNILRLELTANAAPSKLFTHEGVVLLALSHDGRQLLSVGKSQARLWDLAEGKLLHAYPHPEDIHFAIFTPSDAFFWTGGRSGHLRRWRTGTAEQIGPTLTSTGQVVALNAPNDDTLTWIETDDRACRFCRWTAAGGTECLWQQPGRIAAAAFRADGARVLTAGWDEAAHLRDALTGEKLGPSLSHGGYRIRALAFSPDGRTLLTGGWDKAVRLWDAATGKSLGPPLMHRDIVLTSVVSPDGRTIAVGGDGAGRHLGKMPSELDGTAAQVRAWIESLTGLELDDHGNTHERDLSRPE